MQPALLRLMDNYMASAGGILMLTEAAARIVTTFRRSV